MASCETQIATIHDRLHRLEEKLDLLLECEAERKASDKVLEKYGKIAFWALISVGGFINWDKIVKIVEPALPH
jgi:hypothetical protein